ncbi:MAG: phasin family protein [Hyphomicrobiaceae bacterium]
MTQTPKFEIPDAVREMAERNAQQMRAAYSQFLDMTKQAQEALTKSSGAVTEGAMEIQTRSMRFAQENVDASMRLMTDLSRARDLKDYFDIQSRFAQDQMRKYSDQVQEIGRLMTDMTGKTQR